ncbi:hypothetical protein [Streptomyces sp. NBC_01264]|uniref:hypothetical protein n=1 Tax=Streptomyces sp. NBC_01264 TaxID=2903804 RepID=UPI00225C2ACE|nr:hypothetical protein [Streptomyces sp. NBC_01264]MCX4784033.1 hypothetical protein [Streptomyces sp. NBC_01264]
MSADTTQHDAIARKLLDEAYSDPAPVPRDTPTPAAVAPGITPFVIPDGYTLREIHRTHADGTTELIRETLPVASLPPVVERHYAAPATTTASAPGSGASPHSLPSWLTANRRRIKAGAYLSAGSAVAVTGGLYGPQIAAGLTTAAAAVWAATLTVLKVVGVAVVIGVTVRFACGGGRRSRTGTFEGTVKGTWRKD